MTNHAGRLYATAIAVLVLFLTWAVVAANPWAAPRASAQVQLISLREQALRREQALVNTILRQRAAAAKQSQQISAQVPAPAPASSGGGVRIVTLPPLTITKTS